MSREKGTRADIYVIIIVIILHVAAKDICNIFKHLALKELNIKSCEILGRVRSLSPFSQAPSLCLPSVAIMLQNDLDFPTPLCLVVRGVFYV